MSRRQLDCLVIGYYEPAFDQHEGMLRQLGEDSVAYRDLRYSFVDLGDRKLTYAGLLSHAYRLAEGNGGNGDDDEAFKSGDIPNLGAVYLTNFLRRHGHEAAYVNLFSYEQEKLARYLAMNPRCVAITTTFYSLNFPVIEIVRGIRRYNAETKIVCGGPLVANHHRRYPPEELQIALDDMGADIYIIESQGEATLARVVEALKDGGDLSKVPNLIYKDDDGTLRPTPREAEANDMDAAIIDWQSFADENLGATLQTRTARSCAFKCSFCAYPTRAGKLTLTSLEALERELDAMKAVGGVENVVFIDDTFNVPLPRFKDICRLLIRKQYGFSWYSYFRCSNSDEEAIALMAESGCKGVFLGIESGSPTILANMDKHAEIEQYREGIRLLKQHGILTFGSFITGFPGETEETVRESVDFIRDTGVDYFRSQIWYCEPGTPIWFRKEQYGIRGEGYNWVHDTMDSEEAMDHIEDMFLDIEGPAWLPQWSFDFWIIPYLTGKGMSFERFRHFVTTANEMLRLDIREVPEHRKRPQQNQLMERMVGDLRGWQAG